MVTIEPKEERVRRAYLAFANRNWAIVSSLMADDVVWHEEGKDDLPTDHPRAPGDASPVPATVDGRAGAGGPRTETLRW